MATTDIIDYLIQVAQLGGSDLHISAGTYPTARVDDKLVPLSGEVLNNYDCRQLILSTLTEAQRARLEKEWELDYAINIEGTGRFRGNACFASGHIEASFRHVPPVIKSLVELGHSPSVSKLCEIKSGLILVSGIGGSGKTTTVASMIQQLATSGNRMILTIEDPIEHMFPHYRSVVRQRQVGTDTPSFAAALRGALRLGADVIVVGELRDLETMRTALAAAETGHLVIATLHTTTAVGAISRLVDAFPEETQEYVAVQLSHILVGIVAQHLIPRSFANGRCLASEVLINNSGIAACLRSRRFSQIQSLLQIGAKQGMHTLDDSLVEMVLTQQISQHDAELRAKNPSQLRQNIEEAIQKQMRSWYRSIES